MTQAARILRALRQGPTTSADIADLLQSNRKRISVALSRLAQMGAIQRAGVANVGAVGRPYVKWRLPV